MNTFLTKISCFEISLRKQSSFILTGLWKNLPSGIIGSIKTETLCLKRAALKCNWVLIVGNIKKSWQLFMSHTVLRGELRDRFHRCQKLSADDQITNIFLVWFKLNKKNKTERFSCQGDLIHGGSAARICVINLGRWRQQQLLSWHENHSDGKKKKGD